MKALNYWHEDKYKFYYVINMNDVNIIKFVINTNSIEENRCIPLSEVDYQKLKNLGDVLVTIIRNNTKPPLGIP